jgi:voltage-gated potassium channel
MATVGYGDKYPLTTEGRLIAVTLMIAGIGLFGTFAGYVASWMTLENQST